MATSGLNEVKEEWENQRKAYTSEFIELDPCIVSPTTILFGAYFTWSKLIELVNPVFCWFSLSDSVWQLGCCSVFYSLD